MDVTLASLPDATVSQKRRKKTSNRDAQKGDDTASSKASKKRKRRDEEVINLESEEPSRKKKKNRTEFEDPRVDATLNNQARKALEYAFIQMNKPSKWKFNKARQNWLIRNILVKDMLPEIYFPLVLKYLSKIQGGSRNKLRETCELFLKEPSSDPLSENQKQVASDSVPPLKSILKPQPGPLISISSSDDVAMAENPDQTAPSSKVVVPSSPVENDTPEVRRARARRLLEALG